MGSPIIKPQLNPAPANGTLPAPQPSQMPLQAATPPKPESTAGHILRGVLSTLAGPEPPKYTVDANGNMQPVIQTNGEAHFFRHALGGILAGAMTGLAGGMEAQSQRGGPRGPVAALAGGFEADQQRYQQKDQQARKRALQEFQMKKQNQAAQLKQKQFQDTTQYHHNALALQNNLYQLQLARLNNEKSVEAGEWAKWQVNTAEQNGGRVTLADIPGNGTPGNEAQVKLYIASHPGALKDSAGNSRIYVNGPGHSAVLYDVTPPKSVSMSYADWNAKFPKNSIPVPKGESSSDPIPQQSWKLFSQLLINKKKGMIDEVNAQNSLSERIRHDKAMEAANPNAVTTDNEGALVDAIGSGHISAERMSYLLARNPQLVTAVTQKFPDFDTSKAESYINTYKDFTSGRTSRALNSGATAILHLNELNQLNTNSSRIPGTAAYQEYQNKVDTVASELASFYANGAAPTIEATRELKATLDSTFNRTAAIKTQAHSMADKLDSYKKQWQNAAPSKSYQAPMPFISQDTENALHQLLGGSQAGPPRGATMKAPGPDGKLHWTNNEGTVDYGVAQ